MTAAKSASKLLPSSSRRHGRLEDEVYRQMFRLEANRPGSELDLALALLYAWNAAESVPKNGQERQWLKRSARSAF